MGMNSDSSVNNGVAMGLNTPQQLQNVNVDKVVDKSALKGIKDDDDALFSWKTFLLSLPVTAAMVYGMDKFNAACKGEKGDYDTSLVGKINNFGEKVGKKVPFVDTVFRKIDSAVNWFKTKVAPKTSVTSSFFNNPSMPESPSVSMMAMGTHAEIASEAAGKLKEYAERPGTVLKGTTLDEVLKLADHNTKRNMKNVERIMEICKAQGMDAVLKVEKFGNIKSIPLLGRLFKKDRYLSNILPQAAKDALSRKIHLSEYANKIQAIIKPNGTTEVGKRLSKLSLRLLEGLTNGTAGGKFAVFMGAYFIADAIKKTIHAPNKKGEKRKVFAENMISNVGMYMTMPLSIIIMHMFGGLQYLGMGKGAKQTENLTKFRDGIEELNKNVDNISKEAYKAKVKELKAIRVSELKFLKTDSIGQKALKVIKNIVYRPVMRFFNTAAVGLERIKPYTKDSGKVMKFVKNAWHKTKGGLGYPVRMGIFMMLVAPFFDKILAKGSHILFGRPMKSRLDEGKETDEAAQHPQPIIAPQQIGQSQPPSTMSPLQQNSNLANNQTDSFQRQNMVDMRNANAGTNYIASEPVQRENLLDMYITQPTRPSMVSKPQEPLRTYIPAEDGVQVVKTDAEKQQEEKLNSIINKADNAASRANKHLHG